MLNSGGSIVIRNHYVFKYNLPYILILYAIGLVIILGVFFPISDGHYMEAFHKPPLIFFMYAVCAVIACYLIMNAGILLSALRGVPAVLIDGNVVTFQKWKKIRTTIDKISVVAVSRHNESVLLQIKDSKKRVVLPGGCVNNVGALLEILRENDI